MKNIKTGVIKYDDKHGCYFIASQGSTYSLHTIDIDELLLGDIVKFKHSDFNEVIELKGAEK